MSNSWPLTGTSKASMGPSRSDALSCWALLPTLALAAIVTFWPASGASAESSAPRPVRMVVIANFENGADTGDKPGEYQFWVEREHLDEIITIRGARGPARRNGQGLYGLLLENLHAFLLDPRFDFTKTYWLFTGISGVDPQVAS